MESEAEKKHWEEFMRENFAEQNMDYDKIVARMEKIIDDLKREGFTVQESMRLLKETSSAIERYSKRCLDNTNLATVSFD